MEQSNRIEISWVALSLILYLFPILPQYVYVVNGLNVVNFLGAFSIVLIILGGKIYKWKLPTLMVPYFLYTGIYAIMYFTEAGIFKAGTYVITSIAIPFLIVGLVNDRYKFHKAIDILIDGGFLLAIIGVIEAIIKVNFIQPLAGSADINFFHEVRYGLLRIMTTFGQPIAYGIYQVFITALIIYRLNTSEITGRKRKFLHVCYALSVLNVILSVSRIPILACIILHILLLYKSSKKKFINYMILGIVIILFSAMLSDALGINIPFISDLLETVDVLLSGSESTSSTIGVGNRFDLWAWVYLSMGDAWIWGKGITTEFAYKVYEWQTKTSIENQYLYILYHNGIVGLAILILHYVTTLVYAKKSDKIYGCSLDENQISFNGMMFVLMFVYYICEFGVQESDMTRIYVIMISLLISYNRVFKWEMFWNGDFLDDKSRADGI